MAVATTNDIPNTLKVEVQETPAILIKARELSAQRLMMAYTITGLFFMLLPGTFLGAWNLLSISERHASSISPAWIQAHGHAQIFGWIGTFILGIGFHSIPKMSGGSLQPARRGWAALLLWTSGALLRWSAGVYEWHWRVMLPLSALLELIAFLMFFRAVSRHRPSGSRPSVARRPLWVLCVMVGSFALGTGLVMNLLAASYISVAGTAPVFPAGFETRFLTLLLYAFIIPTIWGFNARWLPVFLGLPPLNETLLRFALVLSITGVVLAQAGFLHTAPWLFTIAAGLSLGAFHLFRPAERQAKTIGVHPSFSGFVRIAYIWLLLATALGICAVYFDHGNGWTGGSRHALTVGFISTMVFAIGQRVLPAFAGMRILYSPRLMLNSLLLLTCGCMLRVSSEILAYEGYWPRAWSALPLSAVCELVAVTLFAANLLLTFRQLPAHEMKSSSAS